MALYNEQNGSIETSIRNLEAFANALHNQGAMTDAQFAKINAEIGTMLAELKKVTDTYDQWDTLIVNGVLDGMISGIEGVAQGLAGIIVGTMSLGDAFSNLGDIVRQFFADFLAQIAKAILQQMILNALAGAGWGGVSSAAKSMGGVAEASMFHSGGVVGGRANRTRDVSPNWFANAPRFHEGGLPGLKRDEVPTILQKGEEVLSKDDPRNVLNGGAAGGPAAAPAAGPTIYNLVDQDSLTQAVMSNPAAGPAIVNVIKANKRQVKQILGVS